MALPMQFSRKYYQQEKTSFCTLIYDNVHSFPHINHIYLPNSWNNVKINCNREVVFTHFITSFLKPKTIAIYYGLTPKLIPLYSLTILDNKKLYFLKNVLHSFI
jgi:hypothetical protein